jgi:hypothetical protein
MEQTRKSAQATGFNVNTVLAVAKPRSHKHDSNQKDYVQPPSYMSSLREYAAAPEYHSFQDSSIDPYVCKYKQSVRQVPSAIVLQSWFRMFERKFKYDLWQQRRREFKHQEFYAWKMGFQARKLYRCQIMGKTFRGLRDYAQQASATKKMSAKVFERSMKDKKMSGLLEQTLAKEQMGTKNQLHTDPENQLALHHKRIQQHMYEAYRHRTVSKLFAAWRHFVHMVSNEQKKASLCLVRAWRQVMKNQPRWPLERVLTILHMWHRYTVFIKCKREKKKTPFFSEKLVLWDTWVSDYYVRRQRALLAEERSEPAIQRRYFMLLCRLRTHRIRKREKKLIAENHFKENILFQLLTSWNKYVRQKGKYNRLMRGVLGAWASWAPRKASFRWRRQYIFRKRVVKCKMQIINHWNTVLRQRQMSSAFMRHQLLEVHDYRRTILQKAIQGWITMQDRHDSMARTR